MKSIIKIIKRLFNILKNKKINQLFYNKYLNYSIKEKYILLNSQQGKDINGNMFYLLKELNKDKYNEYKKFVAVEKKYKKEFKDKFDTYNIKNYKFVEINSRKYMKVLATSKYLFNDTSFLSYFLKRKEQIYFNTWHGTPFKTLGRSMKEDFYNLGNVQRNFLFSDYLLYPSEFMKKHMIDDYMIENISTITKTFMSGYPRNEIFFDNERRANLRKELQLDDKKIIMYMPTWRGVFKNLDQTMNNQVEIINNYLKEIDKKLNEDEIMFVNFHPFLKDKIKLNNYKKIKMFDKKYETYDFLNIGDILITDYSSVFFDFAVTKRKIILFAYDEEEYFKVRGTYFNFEELPFEKVKDINSLINAIHNPKDVNTDNFLNKFCKYESKNASKIIIDFIFKNINNNIEIEKIKSNNKKNILIYCGNLNKNGITSSLNSLLNHIDLEKNNYYLTYISEKIIENKKELNKYDKRIKFISFNNNFIGTFKEKIAQYMYIVFNVGYNRNKSLIESLYKKEIIRKFGYSKFDTVIQYTGYGANIINLFSYFDAHKIIYVHSDMLKEIKTRKNTQLHIIQNAYKKYDNVLTVNESIIKSTKEISQRNNVFSIRNLINDKEIIKKSKQNFKFDENTLSNFTETEIKNILKNDKKKIISIGRFSKEKGYERLIDKFIEIESDSYLIIVGGFGPLYSTLYNKINKSNKKDNIIIINSLSNPFPILKESTAMVISSFYEGLPMVLYEAVVLNKPVVSTNIESIKSFMQEYGGGLIVDNSEEGIKLGLETILTKEIKLLNIDIKEYNKKAIKDFERFIEK